MRAGGHCVPLDVRGHNITYRAALLGMHNLDLITRKHQTNTK